MDQREQNDKLSFKFSEADLKNPIALASKLCHAQDDASLHVRGLLDETTLQTIGAYLSTGASEEMNTLLVTALNRLLDSPRLFHPSAFETAGLSDHALRPENWNPHLSGDALTRVNRLLLQETYRDEVTACEVEIERPLQDATGAGSRTVSAGGTITDSVIVAGDSSTITIINFDALHALSEFEVEDAEKEEVRASFVPPIDYVQAAQGLDSRGLIWIVGPADAGKSAVALYLAQTSQHRFRSTYKIHGTRAWSVLSESGVEDSVVILMDAIYLTGSSGKIDVAPVDIEVMDESEIEDEEPDLEADSEISSVDTEAVITEDAVSEDAQNFIHPLRRVLSQGNTVIITSTEEVYAKARDDSQLSACLRSDAFVFCLNQESYGKAERLRLIKKGINLARRDDEVKQWALRACDKLEHEAGGTDSHPIFTEWLPGEICSFVASILDMAKSPDEIETELRVPLSKRVYSWFMQLNDESARFFVLARAIFPSLEENELHKRMEEIVNKLKKTYSLALAPLSVYAYGATPYISDSRPYQFINAHVLKATTDVVAEFYHQPFCEITPLLEQWSVPPQLNPATGTEGILSGNKKWERDQLIEESTPSRDAVARMAGRVGRFNVASVRDLLNYWASHPLGRVGQAAGIALRQIVTNDGNYEAAFALLEQWIKKSPTDTGHFRKRSAADALWRILAAGPAPPQCRRAIKLLEYLARDSNPYVRRAVAHASSQVLQVYPPAMIRELLELLAKDSNDEVRTHLALCLTAIRRQREEVGRLIKEWVASEDPGPSQIATFYLLMNWGRKEEQELLYQIINERPELFQEAMGTAIRLVLRRKGRRVSLALLRRVLNDLAERSDHLPSRQAVIALSKLRRGAATYKRNDVETCVRTLLKRWATSPKDVVRLTALACKFAASQSREEKMALLKGEFSPLAFVDQVSTRMQLAKWLGWMATQDREVVCQLLQDLLVTNQTNAVATVVFYWLVAGDACEQNSCDYLSEILCYFPTAFEKAMQQAIGFLPPSELIPTLQRLALDDRALVRKQTAIALGRIGTEGDEAVNQLLQDWLALDNANAGATVVFYWLAAGDYPKEQRCECLISILHNFPLIFDRGIREAVSVWDMACLEPTLDQLRQLSLTIPRVTQ